MTTGQAFLLVYDITSRRSFEEMEQYREQTLRNRGGNWVPMVLIGLR
jgi:GTPase KRas protein